MNKGDYKCFYADEILGTNIVELGLCKELIYHLIRHSICKVEDLFLYSSRPDYFLNLEQYRTGEKITGCVEVKKEVIAELEKYGINDAGILSQLTPKELFILMDGNFSDGYYRWFRAMYLQLRDYGIVFKEGTDKLLCEIPISFRVENTLVRNGFYKLSDFNGISYKQIYKLPLGQTSLRPLLCAINLAGYKFEVDDYLSCM